MRDLRDWGWSAFFEDQLTEEERKSSSVFRVIEVQRGKYRILGSASEGWGEIAGKMRYEAVTPSQLPAVGDWVVGPSDASIERVLRRRTMISRAAAGNRSEEQVIAANVDKVVITTSLNEDLNLRRLERYLVAAWSSGATPLILLTKLDLCSDAEAKREEVRAIAPGVNVIAVSVVSGDGLEELKAELQPKDTLVLVGSSGVGKSSLLNHLFGEERLRTGGVRNDDAKGRHTTTARTLYRLAGGAIVIDTPGVRELEPWGADQGLSTTFEDVEAIFASCRFRDCGHGKEPGCAVHAALASGTLAEDRWQSYLKLRRETEYQERKGSKAAFSEQRKRWKSITKSLKQHKKDR